MKNNLYFETIALAALCALAMSCLPRHGGATGYQVTRIETRYSDNRGSHTNTATSPMTTREGLSK